MPTDGIALVTRASGGIGRAVAARLARDGMTVEIHYSGRATARRRSSTSSPSAAGRALQSSSSSANGSTA